MTLSGKEKRVMRARANTVKPSVQIGKEGLSEKTQNFITEAFNNKDLVKVKVLDNCPEDYKEIAKRLSAIENTEVVQTLGRTILLYRPLEEE